MKRSPRPRRTAELSESLHQQLNMYALAAGAAGVGLLALAPPAEAKIIYTPANVTIGPGPAYGIDLDHDGAPDIYLRNTGGTFYDVLFAFAWPIIGNGVVESHSSAVAISRGKKIGSAEYVGGGLLAEGTNDVGSAHWTGQWANGGKGLKNRYLGIKFKSGGQFHYGWARVTVIIENPEMIYFDSVLTGYAYETIPNKPIVAGKTKGPDVITIFPANLGHLAAGASAMPAWRSGK